MQGVIPLNKEKTEYSGFIEANGTSYRIDILLPNGPNLLSTAKIQCDWRLHKALEKHLSFLKERLNTCDNVEIYLREIVELLQVVENDKNQLCSPAFYNVVVKHMQDLGMENITDVSSNLKTVEVKILDNEDRVHKMTINLPPNYPLSPPMTHTITPDEFTPLWTHDSDLNSVVDQFKVWLAQYQCLWNNVDELEARTWILEPENPNRAATNFRVGLGHGSSIQIKVDPLTPQGQPECHFLGADWSIVPIQEKFHENLENWNEELSIYQNLCTVLDMELPVRRTTVISQDMTLQCGICHSYRLGVAIPDQICNEQKCSQSFHHSCLMEWMKSVPATKHTFNSLVGQCPYCTFPMKMKLTHD